MSVPMSILAILEEGPSYGLQLKTEFESRTGGVWPLNVGQVYTTLDRLERDGLARSVSEGGDGGKQKVYEITDEGRAKVRDWFSIGELVGAPPRDGLVLKLVMAASHPGVEVSAVIQTERKGAVQLLQQYTRLKSEDAGADLGWHFLLDSLIFQTEARVRWLDACEARLARSTRPQRAAPTSRDLSTNDESEVLG
ncbi:MAG: PadR family transcriptional regulator [Actinomycetota bacterium]|nr:PadR family transcriptional regulator [Actinomycetota bacterium]